MPACSKSLAWPNARATLPTSIFCTYQCHTQQNAQANIKPMQIAEDVTNDPYCYMHIPCTSIKSLCPHIELPFRKWCELDALNSGPLCTMSKGFLSRILKSSMISSSLSSVITQHFDWFSFVQQ